MIYSRKNDFLFVKGKKVAGTSVEMALSTLCGPEDIITPIMAVDELQRLRLGGKGAQNYSRRRERERAYLENLVRLWPSKKDELRRPRIIYKNHMGLSEFVRRYGSLPTQRIFCVERNPYAKIISGANMSVNFDRYKHDGVRMECDLETLRTFISNMFELDEWECNLDRYRDADGGLSLRVLRFESLAEEFARLMGEYRISPSPSLPHAKEGLNSNSIDPREVFTRAQLDRINEIYAEEFDIFGYERL